MRRTARKLTTADTATMAWFRDWLAWTWRRDNTPGDAGPPPTPPPGVNTTGMPEYETKEDSPCTP
jgi:hypothetical protein